MASFKMLKDHKQVLLWPQWLAAFEVFLMSLMYGVNLGWIIPFVGRLSRPNAPFVATVDQISWVASLTALGRPIGAVLGTITSSLLGNKSSIYICGIYYLIGWIALIAANSIEIVFISLLFSGISLGTLQTTFSVYIAEIADPTIRGKLVGFVMQGFAIGNLLGNITGAYLEPWMHGAINIVPTLAFICTFIFFPHTPHYLIRCNKMDEAIKSIKWYNRLGDPQEELENLTEFLKSSPALSFVKSVRELMGTPVNRNTFIKLNVVYSLVQLFGMYAIIQYMEVLFAKANVDVIEPSLIVILQSIVSISTGWISALYLSDKFGRISILLCSCTTLSIAAIGWGTNYQLLDLGYSDPNLQWLTIISALLYRTSITIGFLSTIQTMIGEMFAPNVKTVAICLTNIFCSICTFISCKNLPYALDLLTYELVFYIFAGVVLFIGLYAKFFILETRGKTLQEIQTKFNERSSLINKTNFL